MPIPAPRPTPVPAEPVRVPGAATSAAAGGHGLDPRPTLRPGPRAESVRSTASLALGRELPVEDPLLEVVHLRLLDDAGQGLDEFAQDGDVLGREGVPVRAVQVCEDLPIPVEDRDLVLPDDDVVVHPDVPGDLPHDVLSLELVVPCDRHRADEAFLPRDAPSPGGLRP